MLIDNSINNNVEENKEELEVHYSKDDNTYILCCKFV